jgi:hypothetical protein
MPKYYRDLRDSEKQVVSGHAKHIRQHLIGKDPTSAEEQKARDIKLNTEYTCLQMRVFDYETQQYKLEWLIAELQGMKPPKVIVSGFETQAEAIDAFKKVMLKQVSVSVPGLLNKLKTCTR